MKQLKHCVLKHIDTFWLFFFQIQCKTDLGVIKGKDGTGPSLIFFKKFFIYICLSSTRGPSTELEVTFEMHINAVINRKST